MVRREYSVLIWENCTELLEKYVNNSFENGFLPNPPLELPDFPAQYPKSIPILSSQILGLFSVDKAGFNSKLSEVIEEKDFDINRLSKMALEDPSTGGNPKKLTVDDMKIM